MGIDTEARQSLEAALELQPSYDLALLRLGILERLGGHRVKALRLFDRVIETSTSPSLVAEANYRMAEVFLALGERERALAHLRDAASAEPDGEWGRDSATYLRLPI